MQGSNSFVSHYLSPMIKSGIITIEAVFILDGLLNFDSFPTAQAIHDNLNEVIC